MDVRVRLQHSGAYRDLSLEGPMSSSRAAASPIDSSGEEPVSGKVDRYPDVARAQEQRTL